MKKDRSILEDALIIVLSEYNLDKKVFYLIKNDLSEKGVSIGRTKGIFNKTIPLQTLDLPMLYWFTKSLYKATNENIISITKFFTDIEEKEFKDYKVQHGRDIDLKEGKLILENVTQVTDDQWTTVLTFKQIYELYEHNLIKYNSKTQRNLKTKSIDNNILEKININKRSVNEIRDSILQGLFIPNTITLNLLKTGEEEVVYNDKNRIIELNGEIDIIDGFHRSLAIIEAVRENKNIHGGMIISLVNIDIEKAQYYIVQEDKRNKINKDHIRYLSQENLENQIVKILNENIKSELRGKITTDLISFKKNNAFVLFSTLAEAIKLEYEIKNQRESRKIAEFLIEFFNEVVGIFYDEFQDIEKSRRNSIVTYSNTFIGFIAFSSQVYYNKIDDWKILLENTLKIIDFDSQNEVWERLNMFENRPLKKDYKEIINYFKLLFKKGD